MCVKHLCPNKCVFRSTACKQRERAFELVADVRRRRTALIPRPRPRRLPARETISWLQSNMRPASVASGLSWLMAASCVAVWASRATTAITSSSSVGLNPSPATARWAVSAGSAKWETSALDTGGPRPAKQDGSNKPSTTPARSQTGSPTPASSQSTRNIRSDVTRTLSNLMSPWMGVRAVHARSSPAMAAMTGGH